MKAVVFLLALVLIVGGAVYHDGPADNHEPDQHGHNEHHDHYQPPPFAEMLPPIGPAGIVLMGVMVEEMGFGKKEPVQPSAPNPEATKADEESKITASAAGPKTPPFSETAP